MVSVNHKVITIYKGKDRSVKEETIFFCVPSTSYLGPKKRSKLTKEKENTVFLDP